MPLPRAPEPTLRAWLAFAHDACDEADAVALAHFRRDIRVERKPDRTFVTAADRAVERAIRDRLAATYPEHGIIGEEEGSADGSLPIRWYIDPIDATHNFMRGVPVFATLLAVELEGELQVGMVSAPAMGLRWWGARGLGAHARDAAGERRISVSGIGSLEEAQLLYSSRRDVLPAMPGFDAVLAAAWRDRGFGDFWGYMLVAEGAAEAMVEVGPAPYDLAAPLVVVEEAGGRLSDLRGDRRIDAGLSVVSNGRLHDELLAGLARRG